jgi:hypothetical protein
MIGAAVVAAFLMIAPARAQSSASDPNAAWRAMPAERRQAILRAYERWKSLSPEERLALERRYSEYRALSPEKKAALDSAETRLEALTPAQRRELRERLERRRSTPARPSAPPPPAPRPRPAPRPAAPAPARRAEAPAPKTAAKPLDARALARVRAGIAVDVLDLPGEKHEIGAARAAVRRALDAYEAAALKSGADSAAAKAAEEPLDAAQTELDRALGGRHAAAADKASGPAPFDLASARSLAARRARAEADAAAAPGDGRGVSAERAAVRRSLEACRDALRKSGEDSPEALAAAAKLDAAQDSLHKDAAASSPRARAERESAHERREPREGGKR